MNTATDDQAWRIEWREGLSVRDPAIDDDHRALIQRVNDLNAGLVAEAGREEILRLMNALLATATEHFANEERMLDAHGYPELARHRAAHARLTADFKGAMDNFARSPVSLTWLAKGLLISRALMEHLAKDDMMYRDFISARRG